MLNAICAAVHIKCILASKVQPKGECSVISMKNQESQRYLFHGRIKVWFLHYNFFSVDRKVFLCVCLSLRGQGNFVSRWSLKGIWIIFLWASHMIYTFWSCFCVSLKHMENMLYMITDTNNFGQGHWCTKWLYLCTFVEYFKVYPEKHKLLQA